MKYVNVYNINKEMHLFEFNIFIFNIFKIKNINLEKLHFLGLYCIIMLKLLVQKKYGIVEDTLM